MGALKQQGSDELRPLMGAAGRPDSGDGDVSPSKNQWGVSGINLRVPYKAGYFLTTERLLASQELSPQNY
jgi:hypothetical protein